MNITLLLHDEIDVALQLRVTALYRQLNASIVQLPLREILAADADNVIAICKEGDEILGIATMVTYKVISGYKGMIEDVVVASEHRGKGLGRKLMIELMGVGKKRGLTEILLFTGHHRLVAKALYESLGFQLKESGLYSFKLSPIEH